MLSSGLNCLPEEIQGHKCNGWESWVSLFQWTRGPPDLSPTIILPIQSSLSRVSEWAWYSMWSLKKKKGYMTPSCMMILAHMKYMSSLRTHCGPCSCSSLNKPACWSPAFQEVRVCLSFSTSLNKSDSQDA